MLRRITSTLDGRFGHSLTGVVLPACAALAVPLLALSALELPAAAVDRIAAPVLGYEAEAFAAGRPPAAQTSRVGGPERVASRNGRRVSELRRDTVRGSTAPASITASAKARPEDGGSFQGGGDGTGSRVDDWTDTASNPSLADPTEPRPGGDEGGDPDRTSPPGGGGPPAPDGGEAPGGGSGGPSEDADIPPQQPGGGEEDDAPEGGDGSSGEGGEAPTPPAGGEDDEESPGNSGNAPGHNKDDDEGEPVKPKDLPPGHDKLDDDHPGNSAKPHGRTIGGVTE